jgi:DNA-directed RNA polymerase sigma subunit (sigma70/sigma32)
MIRNTPMFTERFVSKCLAAGVSERGLMVVMDRVRGVTLRAIAEDEGLTPERVRQIESHTIRRLLQKGLVRKSDLM